MSEEKKQQADGGNKSRRRGYFIQPPAPQNAQETAARSEQKPASARPDSGADKGARPHHKSHHRPANKNRHGSAASEQNQPETVRSETASSEIQHAPTQKSAAPQSGNGTNQGNSGNQGKKKNNRNKNRHKSKRPKEDSAMPATKDLEPAEQAAAKERVRPRSVMRETKPVPAHVSDEYEEYKLYEDEPESINGGTEVSDDSAPRTEVIGVRFKSSGKTYYFNPRGITFKRGSHAIVDTARGQEYGEVSMANTFVKSADIVPPLREVVRAATPADTAHHADNKLREEEAFKLCNEKISAHRLEMKLIDAQYTFDNTKLLFYFTSADRVDFRELVKDLASVFRTRIELRQIGIRDEAKLMGGLGICGRPLCCKLFLSDFDQVSIKMAKEQNLSLNSAKISGICGRLMCCLKYEHEAYEYEIKRTPPVDSLVRTENGDGIVTEINPLRGLIKVRLIASPEQPPKYYNRDDVTMLRKKQNEAQK